MLEFRLLTRFEWGLLLKRWIWRCSFLEPDLACIYQDDLVVFWTFFVHDGINSVADYNSLRVGVGWMDVWMSGANFTMG